MAKKGCGQVNIPTVDNSSPCTKFINSGCVTMDFNSSILRSFEGDSLNEYLKIIETRLKKNDIEIKTLKSTIKNLISTINN